MKYYIEDWLGKTCFFGKEFDCFEEAWRYIYDNAPNLNDGGWDDDYYVVAKSNYASDNI